MHVCHAAGIWCIVLCCTPSLGQAVTVEEVEAKTLAARHRIQTMTAEMQIERTTPGSGQETWNWKLWWEGSKRNRGDLVRSGGMRECHVLGCERPDWILYFRDKPNLCAEFKPLAKFGATNMFANIDPRYFGCASASSDTYAGLASVPLGRTDRDQLKLQEVTLDGGMGYEMKWRTLKGSDLRVIVRPDRGWNVQAIETKYQVGQKRYVETVVADLAFVRDGGVWFPTRVVFTQTVDGVAQLTDAISFHKVTVNQPIPAGTFTIEGAAIPEGQPFCLSKESPEAPFATWKGGKLVKLTQGYTEFKDNAPVPVNPPGSGLNYWLVGACVACSLAAVTLLFIRRRRR